MVYLTLQLTSNESTFEYSFPQEFLDKNYEIALIKLDGVLEINNKISINYTNNKFYYRVAQTKLLSDLRRISKNWQIKLIIFFDVLR
jgi:hypothetical protein